jgi:hypothetical protein
MPNDEVEPPFIPDNWDQHVPIDNPVSNDFYLPTNEDFGLPEFNEETLIPGELPPPASQLHSTDTASDEVQEDEHEKETKSSTPLSSRRATYSLREVAQMQGANPAEAVSKTQKLKGFLGRAVDAAGGRRKVANGALITVGVGVGIFAAYEAYKAVKKVYEEGGITFGEFNPDAELVVEDDDDTFYM